MADYVDDGIDDTVDDDSFEDEVVFSDEEVTDLELVDVTTGELSVLLTEEEARDLTETIRNAAEMLWMLIARAHQGKAWESLGYDTWEAYVRAEFDMSRSRSYQLLDQGRVIQAIESAVPEGTPVSLTEAAARDLKGVLDEVIPEIRESTEGLEPSEATIVLEEIVEKQRDNIREEKEAKESDLDEPPNDYQGNGDYPPSSGNKDDDEMYDDVEDIDVARIRRNVNAAHDVYSALSALSSLPDDLSEVVAIIPDERHEQIDANLSRALENLNRFNELWGEHGQDEDDEDYEDYE